MNLKSLSHSALLDETKRLVQKEREFTAQVLHYLKEIEARRLYLERGFSSMHAFCTGYLNYDESQAHRRISAMRVLRQLPEAEDKIRSGKLTMTSLTQAQSFFKKMEKTQTPLALAEKREILQSLEGKSTRQVEKELIKLDPCPMPKKMESQRALTPGYLELKVVIDEDTMAKLERLKELLSHQNLNMGELIDKLAEMALTRLDPERKKEKTPTHDALPHASPKVNQPTSASARYIPSTVRQAVWKRDDGRCSYVDPLTKRRCASKYRLQFDHVLPYALGGATTEENLRLYCQQHNIFHGVQTFGKQKMSRFISKLES